MINNQFHHSHMNHHNSPDLLYSSQPQLYVGSQHRMTRSKQRGTGSGWIASNGQHPCRCLSWWWLVMTISWVSDNGSEWWSWWSLRLYWWWWWWYSIMIHIRKNKRHHQNYHHHHHHHAPRKGMMTRVLLSFFSTIGVFLSLSCIARTFNNWEAILIGSMLPDRASFDLIDHIHRFCSLSYVDRCINEKSRISTDWTKDPLRSFLGSTLPVMKMKLPISQLTHVRL